MSASVRVTGYREVYRAFNKLDKGLAKHLRDSFKEAAEPVVRTIIGKLGRYQGVSTQVRPHVLGRGVFVRQDARKVTGRRGDFGATQMRNAFIPGLEENEGRIHEDVDQGLGRFIDSAGF